MKEREILFSKPMVLALTDGSKTAGVMLMELVPEGGKQTDLFEYSANSGKKDQLMTTMDRINKKYSRGNVKAGIRRD